MAETKPGEKTTTGGSAVPPEATNENKTETNPGTASREAYATADTTVAEKAGISEGDVKALRDEAGVDQLAGHEADIHAWSLTEAGKAFKDGEKDRIKAEKDAAKRYDEQTNSDGLTEAEANYREAVSKG